VVWKDECSSLLPLKGVENSHPLQVADCAIFQVTESFVGSSAFAWWFRSCLEQCHHIKELEIPKKYLKCRCQMAFDKKLGQRLQRKARFVTRGHATQTLSYAVPSDSVRITLVIAAWNDLCVKATLLCG
jgi:hypothetical protein